MKFRTKLRISIVDFRLIFLMIEDFQIKLQLFLVQKKPETKIENRDTKFY